MDGLEGLDLNSAYLRRLVIDSLMVYAGRPLTPDIINEVATEVVQHFAGGIIKIKEINK